MARQYGTNSQASAEAQRYLSQQSSRKAVLYKTIETIVSLAVVGVGVISIISGVATSAAAASEAQSVMDTIAARQAVLQEVQDKGMDSKPIVQTENVVSNTASEDGDKVCELQNELNTWVLKEYEEGKTTLYPEHQTALAEFRNYFPVSTSNEIARTWCEYGVWYFDNDYAFEGNNTSVVWKCYAKDDTQKTQMLAFVTAKYDATTHTFTNGEIIRTKGLSDLKEKLSINIPTETEEPTEPEEPPVIIETEEPIETIEDPVETEETEEPDYIIIQVSPEPEYFYGWSTQYNCWGYFSEDGRFLTEEQYNNEVGGI